VGEWDPVSTVCRYIHMRGIYIEQIILVNSHIQHLMFIQQLMKRNKAKNLMRKYANIAKKGKRILEVNMQNSCETDFCSLLFALKQKIYEKEYFIISSSINK
jgi:hypothetical protein